MSFKIETIKYHGDADLAEKLSALERSGGTCVQILDRGSDVYFGESGETGSNDWARVLLHSPDSGITEIK